MENASKQAYAILRLAIDNSSLEVIKTREGKEEANKGRDVIAFLDVLNQVIYSRDIPVNDRIFGQRNVRTCPFVEEWQVRGEDGIPPHVKRIQSCALRRHGVDPLCTYEEMRGEIRQTVQNLLDVANNDITNVEQVMTHLSDWTRARSEENLARLAILNACNDDLIHYYSPYSSTCNSICIAHRFHV